MEWILVAGVAIALVVVGVIAQRRGWIDLSGKSVKRGGSAAIGVVDEIFAPTRHEAQVEQERQTVLPAPAPLPGDDDRDFYRGNLKIDVTRRDEPAAPER